MGCPSCKKKKNLSNECLGPFPDPKLNEPCYDDCCLEIARGTLVGAYYEAYGNNPGLREQLVCIRDLMLENLCVEGMIAGASMLIAYSRNPSLGATFFEDMRKRYDINLLECNK